MNIYYSAFKTSVIHTVQASNCEERKKNDNQLEACRKVFCTASAMQTKPNGQRKNFSHHKKPPTHRQ
jgi:hypothetical protein